MENKVENINIEKNKELFEYEMTEVILRLKGEFAAFSGKDTKFAEMVVDDARLHIAPPKVAQVDVEDCSVETPMISSVPKTKTAHVEVKETTLQLPVIPKMTDESGKKEESSFSTKKANIWQGIVLPSLPLLSKPTFSKGLPEKSLKDVEKEIISSVEIPPLASIFDSAQKMKKEAHTAPVLVHVPRIIRHSNWNKGRESVQCKKSTSKKTVPNVGYDSAKMMNQLEGLSTVPAVDRAEIKVPYIVTNITVGTENVKKVEAHTIEVPQVNYAGGYSHAIPSITCESSKIDVPRISSFDYCELKKTTIATHKKKIEFQESHSFKYEIKNPTVSRAMLTVPELKYMQECKLEDVCIKHQPILAPDTPRFNDKKESVCIRNAQVGVVLPKTEISKQPTVKTVVVSEKNVCQTPDIPVIKKAVLPDVQRIDIDVPLPHKTLKTVDGIQNIESKINVMAFHVPIISYRRHEPLSLNRVVKPVVDVPSTIKPHFAGLATIENKQATREIEVHPVKVNGNLDKVSISYNGTISIPQKPEVKETVDNIIALVVAKC